MKENSFDIMYKKFHFSVVDLINKNSLDELYKKFYKDNLRFILEEDNLLKKEIFLSVAPSVEHFLLLKEKENIPPPEKYLWKYKALNFEDFEKLTEIFTDAFNDALDKKSNGKIVPDMFVWKTLPLQEGYTSHCFNEQKHSAVKVRATFGAEPFMEIDENNKVTTKYIKCFIMFDAVGKIKPEFEHLLEEAINDV